MFGLLTVICTAGSPAGSLLYCLFGPHPIRQQRAFLLQHSYIFRLQLGEAPQCLSTSLSELRTLRVPRLHEQQALWRFAVEAAGLAERNATVSYARPRAGGSDGLRLRRSARLAELVLR